MTYPNIQSDQLYNKLRLEFSYRIESKINSSRNVRRSSGSVKVRSALRDVTPSGDNNRDISANAKSASSTYAAKAPETKQKSAKTSAEIRPASNYSVPGAAVEEKQPYGSLMNKYAGLRAYAGKFNEKAYLYYNPEAESNKKVIKEKKSFGVSMKERFKSLFGKDEEENEGKVIHNNKFSKKFVAGLVAVTAVLLMVLYTSSVYSSALSEVKTLRDEQTELIAERDRLVNLLGVMDNIREIEDYAVNEIGMVKSDCVEKRSISIAGGEHIEVIDATDEEDTNLFSTLLSAMGGNLELIKDYID